MMDDYLWNKTGSDPEIERIEAALKSHAYRQTEPPQLPAKQFVFDAALAHRGLWKRFVPAFVVLTVAAISGAWFLMQRSPEIAQHADTIVTAKPEKPTFIRQETPVAVTQPAKNPARTDRPTKRENPRRKVIRNHDIRPQTLVLTKEEADAYRQLMTALAITSSNLKIVKEKLSGKESLE